MAACNQQRKHALQLLIISGTSLWQQVVNLRGLAA